MEDAAGRARLRSIGQVHVNVRDLARATAFYRDVLGLPFLFDVPGQMSFFDCGGVRVMLGKAEKVELDHPSSILYYDVGDIAAAHTELEERGVRFEAAPRRIAEMEATELWMAFFRDSEENLMALMSEVPRME